MGDIYHDAGLLHTGLDKVTHVYIGLSMRRSYKQNSICLLAVW